MSRSYNRLSGEDRNKLVQFLLESSHDGKPGFGKVNEAATLFKVDRGTVRILWAKARSQVESGKSISLVSPRLGLTYKKRVSLDRQKLKSIDFQQRSTIRDLAKGLEVSKSSVGRWITQGLIRPHTNPIKPVLTELNKLQRIQYSLSQLDFNVEEHKIKFKGMRNVIHIDEKWFFITKATRRVYKLPEEPEPYRSCKSKRFITKVMFICAVGRPQYASDGTMLFDGKVGMFPFTIQQPTKRNSKNRLKGTLEMKNIQVITKKVIKDCIITKVSTN